MSREIVIGAAGVCALLAGLAVWAIVRRRNQRVETAREMHRFLLLRLLDHVRYMPGMTERDIWAAQSWLRSRRRWHKRVPYDQGIRMRRLLRSVSPEQRQRLLLDVIEGPCITYADGSLGQRPLASGPLVAQLEGWLDSDPLDVRIGQTLVAAGCRVKAGEADQPTRADA